MLDKHFIRLTSLLFFISSCNQDVNHKLLSQTDLEDIRKNFKLPKEKTFILDTNYIYYLSSLDTAMHREAIKNHYQPLQASYYDKEGHLISFHVNCYAGLGIADKEDLNWNQRNAFDSFLPKTVAPLDTILTLSKHLQFIKSFENKPIDTIGFSNFDYTVIIHWNKKLMEKDSRTLINIVSQNALLTKGKKLNILYVNNDNSW